MPRRTRIIRPSTRDVPRPSSVVRAAVGTCLLLLPFVTGCGDANPPESVAVDPSAEAVIGPRTQNPTEGGEPEYGDPLVPPIDLGGGGLIRTEGAHRVDPLGLEAVSAASIVEGADFSRDERASFHAHGSEVCASGCAASRHPTPVLDRDEFESLMFDFAKGPMDETNPALESLMFYGRQTTAWLDQLGIRPLSPERAAFLRNELQRTHALISFRIVDEHGVIRTHMPPTRVPLDRRHVFEMETERLPALETSGTVKRVGLHHLWTRL